MISFHETPSGTTFAVKVHPRAKNNAIAGEFGNALKLSLSAPPAEGRANEACLKFVANLFEGPAILRYHSIRQGESREGDTRDRFVS
jgi:uncharacterized protein YggU (UPF0235/DUF167 family)